MPGMPSTPSAVETGASAGSIFRTILAVGDGVGLPAVRAEHDVARGKAVEVRGHDLADRAALHHLPDGDRRGVGRRIAHPPAHVGIERQPKRAQQHLARPRLRDRHFLDAKIALFRLADRPRRQQNALAGVHAHTRLG